jgi:hypothetical protein
LERQTGDPLPPAGAPRHLRNKRFRGENPETLLHHDSAFFRAPAPDGPVADESIAEPPVEDFIFEPPSKDSIVEPPAAEGKDEPPEVKSPQDSRAHPQRRKRAVAISIVTLASLSIPALLLALIFIK